MSHHLYSVLGPGVLSSVGGRVGKWPVTWEDNIQGPEGKSKGRGHSWFNAKDVRDGFNSTSPSPGEGPCHTFAP